MLLSFDTDLSAIARKASAMSTHLSGQALAPQLVACNAVVMAGVRMHFLQSAPGGGEWPDLSPATKATRTPPGTIGKGILIKSGRLLASLRPGDPDSIEEVMPDGIRGGTRVPYAPTHDRGSGRIPQRRILVAATEQVVEQVRSILMAAVGQAIRAA